MEKSESGIGDGATAIERGGRDVVVRVAGVLQGYEVRTLEESLAVESSREGGDVVQKLGAISGIP